MIWSKGTHHSPVMQNWKKDWFVVSKTTRVWWFLTWALKILKISTLIDSFCAKYVTFDLKKYRGVTFNNTEERCQISRKTYLGFGKWHKEYGKFSPEHLKVSKLGLSWDPFIQSRKCMSLEFTKELCVMTMQNDARFEEGLLVVSKLTWRVWRVLHSQVSKICPLMSSFWTKHTLFELKKYRGVMFHDIEEWCKIWRKADLWIGKWHEEFGRFLPEQYKVSKVGFFYPK